MLTRRSFLTGLGAAVGIVAAEPVRRIWVVGAQLSRPDGDAVCALIDRITHPAGEAAEAMRRLGEAGFRAGEALKFSTEPMGARYPDGSLVTEGSADGLAWEPMSGADDPRIGPDWQPMVRTPQEILGDDLVWHTKADRVIRNPGKVKITYQGVELKPAAHHGRLVAYTSYTPTDKQADAMTMWFMGEMG